MRGIDTNVLVRLVTRDDPAQFRRVRKFLETRFGQTDAVFVNVIVLCETVWVLRSAYLISRRETAAALDRLLGERNRAAGCVSTATLDRRLKSASAFHLV